MAQCYGAGAGGSTTVTTDTMYNRQSISGDAATTAALTDVYPSVTGPSAGPVYPNDPALQYYGMPSQTPLVPSAVPVPSTEQPTNGQFWPSESENQWGQATKMKPVPNQPVYSYPSGPGSDSSSNDTGIGSSQTDVSIASKSLSNPSPAIGQLVVATPKVKSATVVVRDTSSHPGTPGPANTSIFSASTPDDAECSRDSANSFPPSGTPGTPACNPAAQPPAPHEPPSQKVNRKPLKNCQQKLIDMGSEPDRPAWVQHYFHFMEATGNQLTTIPKIVKHPLDLYRLYTLVKQRGGLAQMLTTKEWKDMTQHFGIHESASGAFTLRKNYCKYILPYECQFDRGGCDPAPILQAIEASIGRRRKPVNQSVPAAPPSISPVASVPSSMATPINGYYQSNAATVMPPPTWVPTASAAAQPAPSTNAIGAQRMMVATQQLPPPMTLLNYGQPMVPAPAPTQYYGGTTFQSPQQQQQYVMSGAGLALPTQTAGHNPSYNYPPLPNQTMLPSSSYHQTWHHPSWVAATPQPGWSTGLVVPPASGQRISVPPPPPVPMATPAPNGGIPQQSRTFLATLLESPPPQVSLPCLPDVATATPLPPPPFGRRQPHMFPPGSVEATQPSLEIKKRKLTPRDVGPIAYQRLVLSLRSGLLAETTLALNNLAVTTADDTGLRKLTMNSDLVQALVDLWRHALGNILNSARFIDQLELPVGFSVGSSSSIAHLHRIGGGDTTCHILPSAVGDLAEDEDSALEAWEQPCEELVNRCLAVSAVLRNLSFHPPNVTVLAANSGLFALIGLILQHNQQDSFDWLKPSRISLWRHELSEDVWVILVNLASQLDFSQLPDTLVRPVADSVLHALVCASSTIVDPFPHRRTLSAQRLALETLTRLCVRPDNVDILLATPGLFSPVLSQLFDRLLCWFAASELPVVREMALASLDYLSQSDVGIGLLAQAKPYPLEALLTFIELVDFNARRAIDQFGFQSWLGNQELIGPSVVLVRRAAGIIDRLVMHQPQCLRGNTSIKLLHFTMHTVLDPQATLPLLDAMSHSEATPPTAHKWLMLQ